MKSHPVTEHEPMEPEYPGLLASIGMILLGWNWLADYGLDLLWAATGIEHERLWPIVHLAVSLFICYACYAKQPVKGVVKYFSLEPIPWRAAVRVPLFYFAILLTSGGLIAFLYQTIAVIGLLPSELSGPSQSVDRQSPSWLFGALVVAPLGEELMMRGVVLRGLLQRHGALAAVLLSAVMFGVFHDNVKQAVGAAVSGIFLGLAFVHTRSLWVPILMHCSHNAFVCMLHAVPSSGPRHTTEPSPFPVIPFSHPGWLGELALCFCILLLTVGLGAWLLWVTYRAFQREFFPSTQPSTAGAADGLLPSSAMQEFKARRKPAASDSA